jgi:REP element-mobilizing transposase RayT
LVDIFSRQNYRDIVIESLAYCREHKGLLVLVYVVMSNHVHLVLQTAPTSPNLLSDILRDFKKFTSKQIISAIGNSRTESRREWMLKIFLEQGTANSRNKKYQFWRQDNQPQELYSPKFFFQKLNYIHNNPLVAGMVEKPEHYLYSSARDYFKTKKCGLLDVSFL